MRLVVSLSSLSSFLTSSSIYCSTEFWKPKSLCVHALIFNSVHFQVYWISVHLFINLFLKCVLTAYVLRNVILCLMFYSILNYHQLKDSWFCWYLLCTFLLYLVAHLLNIVQCLFFFLTCSVQLSFVLFVLLFLSLAGIIPGLNILPF